MSLTPVVAIVGRPNVGKSTLFNRLVGRKQAIVHDQPGVTRDRIVGLATLDELRAMHVIDTGGLVPGDDPLGLSIQVYLAIAESDLVLFVVDGKQGLVTPDEHVRDALRATGKPLFLVINKADTRAAEEGSGEFYRLGVPRQLLVSAEHGQGVAELREALAAALPEGQSPLPAEAPAIAIVGRPNVGKSSLLNRIAGQERALVSPVAGTTRDPVDTLVEHGEGRYLFIDTAGIRRRSQTTGEPEELAVLFARRQMERAEVVVLVIDAAQGVGSGDLAIAGAAWELGRAVVVAVNKWDLLDEDSRQRLDLAWPRLAELLAQPERVNISCRSGRGVEKIFPALDRTLLAYRRNLGTGELNRLIEAAVERVQPPAERGRPWRFYYATQVASGPPTFMLFANRTLRRGGAYRKYLENRLREDLQLAGIPIRLVVRQRTEKATRRKNGPF